MMHRDLKSPNVLLSEEGVAKIADVGMVRAQVKDLVTAQPVMTPLWAAPEASLQPNCCQGVRWASSCNCSEHDLDDVKYIPVNKLPAPV